MNRRSIWLPEIFKPLFVHGEVQLNSADVVKAFRFPASVNDEEKSTQNYLEGNLLNASNETLEDFLTFATGGTTFAQLWAGEHRHQISSIFASTCLQDITFPRNFPNENTFSNALDAVVSTVSVI